MNFDKRGLIPAIIQNAISGQVLILAYMNQEALAKTLEAKAYSLFPPVVKLWMKGEFRACRRLKYCSTGPGLPNQVEQNGVACHTGHYSCFFRNLKEQELEDNYSI